MKRAERYAQVAALYAEGLTTAQISERIGIKKTHIRGLMQDPDGSKRRRQKINRGIPCESCGGPTFGRNGNGNKRNVTGRCHWCLCGKRNPYLPPEDAPTRIVTLQDVDLKERLAGAWDACCATDDIGTRYELLAFALWPTADRHEIRAAA